MTSHPFVSIIIPTYNYAHFICEAIESVLTSSFPINEVEIIVIDDGSTDDTAKKVKIYEDKVKYITQDNSGKARATKVGIDRAEGKYIFNLDADDLFLPNKIQEVVEAFESNKDVVHVAHPALCWNIIDDTKNIEPVPETIMGRKIVGKNLLSYFYRRGILFGGGSTFAARAEVLKHVIIPKQVDMLIDEYLVLATLNQGCSLFLQEPLSIWRIHGENFSGRNLSANHQKKFQRNLASSEAVLINLENIGAETDIQRLYQLKTKVTCLAIEERLGNKNISGILSMWLHTLNNSFFFGTDTFEIIKAYNLLNRTLPTFLVMLLKRILRK